MTTGNTLGGLIRLGWHATSHSHATGRTRLLDWRHRMTQLVYGNVGSGWDRAQPRRILEGPVTSVAFSPHWPRVVFDSAQAQLQWIQRMMESHSDAGRLLPSHLMGHASCIRMTKVPLFWMEGEAQTAVSFWLSVSVLHAWDNLVQIYIITIRKVRCVLKRSFRLRDVRFILAWSVSSLDDHSIGI